MLHGIHEGGLEVRQEGDGARVIAGRFPYGVVTMLSDGGRTGRPKKERFLSRAFAYRVDRDDEDIHLLVGHDYGKPLASRKAGTLRLTDGTDALSFEARITPEIAATSHGRDALAMIGAGLSAGLSPGFRMPHERAMPAAQAERIEEEPPGGADDPPPGIIRTIAAAMLYELSVVTRPAYDAAQVEARSWTPRGAPQGRPVAAGAYRWR